jgi:hypothetical protein
MNLHLILTFFWFLLGSGLLAWQALHPNDTRFSIWGSSVSVGWVALLLGLYNLARWWSRRSGAALEQAELTLRRHRKPATYRTDEPPNPELDFSKPAPQPEAERPPTG